MNNILAKNTEEDPLYKFMKFDYYKPEERIQ